MAETTQIKFKLSEIAEALVRQQGIHEGKWIALPEFSFGNMIMGATPGQSYPTAIVQVHSIVLNDASTLAPGTDGVVDASLVNPPDVPKSAKK